MILMVEGLNSKDYTIVTACRNREENLRKAINSWVNIDPYEIIIIDWGSERPLKSNDFEVHIKKYIKIIRYEHPNWVLTWAFNEGLSKVKTKYTIKLDCDHVVNNSFLEENKCSNYMLIRGSHRYVTDGQEHINGAFICCSELLKTVGYFDERITTYGWDDSDLYLRISDFQKKFRLIREGSIRHLDQDNKERTKHQEVRKEDILSDDLNCSVEKFCIMRNRFLTRFFDWEWDENCFKNRDIKRQEIENNKIYLEIANFKYFYEIKKNFYYENRKELKTSEIIDHYYQLLKNDFKQENFSLRLILPEILDRYQKSLLDGDNYLNQIIKYNLLSITSDYNSQMNKLLKIDEILGKQKILKRKSKRLIIRPMHGLGNRLRVLASAYNIAKNSGRDLVICWDKDEHLNSDFYELFREQEFEINFSITTSKFLENINEISFYNYMENELYTHKDKEINLETDLDILITSSCVIKSDLTDWNQENKFLKSLKVSYEIEEIINQVSIDEDHVGVHIRYDGDNWEDLPHENVKHWNEEAHEILKTNRNNSKPEFFADEMLKMLRRNKKYKFFISAAKLNSINFMLNKFDNNIIDFIKRPNQADHRDSLGIKYAMADMILLSKCKYVLGSGWSSFTEGAQRFSNHSQIIKIAGEDF